MQIVKLTCAGLLMLLSGCSADPAPKPDATGKPAPTAAAKSTAIPGAVPFGTSKAKLVDTRVALEKPKVIKVASGLNPDGAGTPRKLFDMGSDVMITMLQSQIRLQRELNGGRNPTFAEFSQTVRQAHITFAQLPAWQMIGYDESTGELSLLEDKGEKIRRYKAKDIPLDEDDKPYDTPAS